MTNLRGSIHESQTLTPSTPIEQLDWFPLGNAAIYRTQGTITALNLDGVTILSQTALWTDLAGSFWLSPDGATLSSLVETQEGWQWWTRKLQN